MSPSITNAFNSEMNRYKELVKAPETRTKAWHHLERAHILGQPNAIRHIWVHIHMIRFALAEKNGKEFLGQVPRILLSIPGSLFRLAPKGNTGGASVGIFQPMEIPEDLQTLLNSISKK